MLNLARVMSTVLSNFISNAFEEYGNVNDLVVNLIFVHGVLQLNLTSLKNKFKNKLKISSLLLTETLNILLHLLLKFSERYGG